MLATGKTCLFSLLNLFLGICTASLVEVTTTPTIVRKFEREESLNSKLFYETQQEVYRNATDVPMERNISSDTSILMVRNWNGSLEAENSSDYMKNSKKITPNTAAPHIQNMTENLCNKTKYLFQLKPDTTNCSNYMEICTQNSTSTLIIKSCSNGTAFDSISSQCVSGISAFCGVYNCPEPDGFFQDPTTNKHTFIHCFDGVPTRKVCEPEGTVFMKESKVCMRLPEQLPIGLKLLQLFVWFVKLTEPAPSDSHPIAVMATTAEYVKAGIVASLITLTYVVTLMLLYAQCNDSRKLRNSSSYLSAEDDLRYYTGPLRNMGVSNSNPLRQEQLNGDNLNGNTATTSF